MQNTLQHKPIYTVHRTLIGTPVAADTADLEALYELPGNFRAGLNCRRWKTVRAFVRLTGGTTIGIAPLEVIEAIGGFPGAADEDRGLAPVGAVVAGLVDGDFFDITINGGLLYLRLHAVGGASTALALFVAGHEVAVSRTGQE